MNPSPSTPKRKTWLLAALVAVVGTLACAWLWLGVDSAQKSPDLAGSMAIPAPTEDVGHTLQASSTSESAASDEIAAPAEAGRTHAGPSSSASSSKPWAEGVIRGRVLGGPGASEPMPAIGVRATSPRSVVPIPERRAMTDALGRFELRGLVAAEWELASFLPPLDLRGTATARIDEANPSTEVEILLPFPRRVDVVIVDAHGRPVHAETLGLDPAFLPLLGIGLDNACRPIGSTLSPADVPRHRCLDRSAKGERNTWDLVIQSAGAGCVHALFADRVIAARPLGTTDQRVEIVLDATQIAPNMGSCAVQVVAAADGTPVTDGSVRFLMAAGVNVSLALDKEGRASVPRCPLGTIDLRIVAPGFVSRGASVSLPAEASSRYELVRARRVSGRIVPESGHGARGFQPTAWRIVDPTARLVGARLQATRYDETERFVFDDLEPAIYVIAAVPESVVTFTADDVRAGKAVGAAYVDLRHADVVDVSLTVPTWLR